MAGRKNFVSGSILTASDVNSFLMDQSVMVFDDSAARTTAIPTPSEGMVTYLKDSDALEKYTTTWEPVNTFGIKQVVFNTTSTLVSTTSTSYQSTGLTGTITPSSTSSKVLAVVNGAGMEHSNTSVSVFITLFRGTTAGTNLATSGTNTFGLLYNQSNRTISNLGFSVLDSPETTSPVTYTVAFRADSANTVRAQNSEQTSTLTLMEVTV